MHNNVCCVACGVAFAYHVQSFHTEPAQNEGDRDPRQEESFSKLAEWEENVHGDAPISADSPDLTSSPSSGTNSHRIAFHEFSTLQHDEIRTVSVVLVAFGNYVKYLRLSLFTLCPLESKVIVSEKLWGVVIAAGAGMVALFSACLYMRRRMCRESAPRGETA